MKWNGVEKYYDIHAEITYENRYLNGRKNGICKEYIVMVK